MRTPSDIDPRRRSGKPTLAGAPSAQAVKAMQPRKKPMTDPAELVTRYRQELDERDRRDQQRHEEVMDALKRLRALLKDTSHAE